jgi:predicted nucleic acid-binding protein
MIYADTDFFIALVKDDDWLQERARALAVEHDDIYTSRATLLELLLISDRFEFDRMAALTHALEIASVPEDEGVLFQAADLMDQEGLTAFDAYHAAYAGTDPVISSDQALDDADIERIPLEREG